MSKKRAASSSSKALSLRLFGSPPLFEGEDAVAYDGLLARVSSAVNPMSRTQISSITSHLGDFPVAAAQGRSQCRG